MSSVNAAIVSGHDDHLNNNCCTSGSDQSSTVTDSFDSSEIKSDHPTLSSFASASAHQTDYDESDNVRFGCPKGCDIAAHRKSPEIGTKHDRTADDEQKDELDEKDRFGDEPIEDRMIGKSIANGSDGALKESASNHSVGGGSPNSTGQYRSTVLANFNSWFNEISSSSLFHNFVLSNPFRRRNSRNSSVPSLCITRSNSKLLTSPVSSTADDSKSSSTVKEVSSLTTKETPSPEPVDEAEAVRKFIGAIQPTLKGKELIELANFGVVEIEPQEPGLGHRFEVRSTLDSCFFKYNAFANVFIFCFLWFRSRSFH